MAKKFSELAPLTSLPLTAGVVTNYNGANYLLTLESLQGLITKTTLGLDRVDNTPDASKPLSSAAIDALGGKASVQHGHGTQDIAGLSELLLQYAPAQHSHGITAINGLQTALDAKSNTADAIAISKVTGLQTALDAKAPTVHEHQVNDIQGLATTLQGIISTVNGKAAIEHTHLAADITDFQPKVLEILDDVGVVTSPVAVGALAW